ncbi:unnamed protein product [Linum tenue]|uniref:Phosphatidic acid phosphatase type 2/haloperoxidase domain-containing protein n=1 Tax=Linum tenue TaxID=586396 RepID=A0AAV0I421_9ROSI|nr:unnamed protein product [Linum tenue]
MISGAALLHRPTSKFFSARPYRTNFSRPSLRIRFSTPESTGFRGTRTNARAGLSSNTMSTESFKSPGISRGRNEESMGVHQQEVLVNDSPEFQALSIDGGGLEATLNSMSKWLVSAAFGAFFLWRHDADALWVATGAVINSVLSVVLKRILNQERPFPTARGDPGMPSSHAQSIFYIVTFGVLATVESLGVNAVSVILTAMFLAIMATSIAEATHSEPSGGWSSSGYRFLSFVVLAME